MHRHRIPDLQTGPVEHCCRQPQHCQAVLQVQKHMKLHITKELTEKDVVSRIMRKENYLIGMLNKVLPPPPPLLRISMSPSLLCCQATSHVLHAPLQLLLILACLLPS